jgi:hypothetical protein
LHIPPVWITGYGAFTRYASIYPRSNNTALSHVSSIDPQPALWSSLRLF